jgi:hypothetical protein
MPISEFVVRAVSAIVKFTPVSKAAEQKEQDEEEVYFIS